MQGTGGLIYLAILVIAFYLLIIRPQMQRTKHMRELMASLAVGDRVITIGGLHGSIAAMEGKTVTLRVADDVELTFEKTAIASKDTGEALTDTPLEEDPAAVPPAPPRD